MSITKNQGNDSSKIQHIVLLTNPGYASTSNRFRPINPSPSIDQSAAAYIIQKNNESYATNCLTCKIPSNQMKLHSKKRVRYSLTLRILYAWTNCRSLFSIFSRPSNVSHTL